MTVQDPDKGGRTLSKAVAEGMVLSKKETSLSMRGGKEEGKVCRFGGGELRESISHRIFFYLLMTQGMGSFTVNEEVEL